MAPRVDEVMKLCCELSANQQIKTAVKGSGKGAAAAGGLAFFKTSPAGGAVGGLLGCWLTSGEFKPLPQIIMELSPPQQQKLYDDVMAVLGDIQWTDVAQLIALVMSNGVLKQQLTAALVGYVTKELQAEVHYMD
uniref:Chromosome 19 open reading frame 12 n=1 Tax=Oryzias latipes TaxID=8090 RepID=A0A3P9M2A1_ORYLA